MMNSFSYQRKRLCADMLFQRSVYAIAAHLFKIKYITIAIVLLIPAFTAAQPLISGKWRLKDYSPFARIKNDQALPLGIWRSNGYGLIAAIEEDQARFYDLTSISCLLSPISSYLESSEFKSNLLKFAVYPDAIATPITFKRISTLPDLCMDGGIPPADANVVDQQHVLSVLCANFKEYYAFSALRHVNFDSLCTEAEEKLQSTSTSEELWETLTEIMRHTKDGHVTLATQDESQFYSAGENPKILLELQKEFETQTIEPDEDKFIEQVLEQIISNTESYLDAPLNEAVGGRVRWSWIGSKAGYIALNGMDSNNVDSTSQAVTLFSEAFKKAIDDLRDLPAIIIDLRLNGGGADPVSLAVAGHFFSKKQLAFTVQARDGHKLTRLKKVMVEPAANPYTGRLILLTSELTASAAETFVLSLLKRPDTHRVGEATDGIFANMLPRSLPNGWIMTLSNEVFRGPDGKVYESVGIPPEVEIDCFTKTDREDGRDSAIEAALDLAEEG